MAELEKQGTEKTTPISYTSMSQTAKPLVKTEMEYEWETQDKINKTRHKIEMLDKQLSDQGQLNIEKTGYISDFHKLSDEKYKQYGKLIDAAITDRNKKAETKNISGIGMGVPVTTYSKEDKKRIRDLKDIQNMYKKIGKILKTPTGKDFESNLQGAWYGLTQSNTAKDFWTLGLNEMDQNLNVKTAFEKFQEAEKELESQGVSIMDDRIEKAMAMLDEEEQSLLEVYQLLQETQAGSRANTGAIVGEGLQDMAPFILEFALTSGTASAGKKVVKEFLERTLKNKVAAKVGGAVSKVGTQAAIMPTTAKGYAERTAPKLDEFGQLEAGEDPFEALWKSYLTTAAEVVGEDVAIMGSRALYQKAIKKMADHPGTAQAFLSKIAATMSAETGVPSVQGVPWELVSEEVTGTLQAMIDNDGSFFTPEAQWQLLLMVTMAGGGAAVSSVPNRAKVKYQYGNAQELLADIPNSNYSESIQDAVNNISDPEELVDAFEGDISRI